MSLKLPYSTNVLSLAGINTSLFETEETPILPTSFLVDLKGIKAASKLKTAPSLGKSALILFNVFEEYEPTNLLLRQAYQEVFDFQLQEQRLRNALERINSQKIIITNPEKPSPFCFPIMTERIRDRFMGEKMEEQVKKMTLNWA